MENTPLPIPHGTHCFFTKRTALQIESYTGWHWWDSTKEQWIGPFEDEASCLDRKQPKMDNFKLKQGRKMKTLNWTSCVVVEILEDDRDIPGTIYGPFYSSTAEADAEAFALKYFPGVDYQIIKVQSPSKQEESNHQWTTKKNPTSKKN